MPAERISVGQVRRVAVPVGPREHDASRPRSSGQKNSHTDTSKLAGVFCSTRSPARQPVAVLHPGQPVDDRAVARPRRPWGGRWSRTCRSRRPRSSGSASAARRPPTASASSPVGAVDRQGGPSTGSAAAASGSRHDQRRPPRRRACTPAARPAGRPPAAGRPRRLRSTPSSATISSAERGTETADHRARPGAAGRAAARPAPPTARPARRRSARCPRRSPRRRPGVRRGLRRDQRGQRRRRHLARRAGAGGEDPLPVGRAGRARRRWCPARWR